VNVKRLVVALWICVVAAAVGLAGLLGVMVFRPAPQQLGSGVYLTAPFNLTDQTGRAVTEKDFRERPTAWFFGFTHCPDVCPTTLYQMSEHLDALGAEANRLNVVFVTVDPERDTVPILKEYLSAFDPRITALTGTPEQISAITKGFFVHAARVPQENGEYLMEHASLVMLTARDGLFKGTLDFHEPAETQLQKLRRLIREG
jgi:protein SCO1